LSDVVAPVADAVVPVVSDVVAPVAEAVTPVVSDVVAPVAEAVTPVVSDVVAPVAEAVVPVVVSGVVAPVAEAVVPVVSEVGAPVVSDVPPPVVGGEAVAVDVLSPGAPPHRDVTAPAPSRAQDPQPVADPDGTPAAALPSPPSDGGPGGSAAVVVTGFDIAPADADVVDVAAPRETKLAARPDAHHPPPIATHDAPSTTLMPDPVASWGLGLATPALVAGPPSPTQSDAVVAKSERSPLGTAPAGGGSASSAPSGVSAVAVAALFAAAAMFFSAFLLAPARWRSVLVVSLIERPG
jgi:hypothetical protein